jgi:hypothetical protein
MINTKQVRDIMRKYTNDSIYTNKLKAENERRVKCYMPADAVEANKMISELNAAAGSTNVDINYDSSVSYRIPRSSVIVTCVIA